jgi:hypothetical protein
MRVSIFIGIFLSFSYSLYSQGWNQKKGEGYFQLGQKSISSDHVFVKDLRNPINGKVSNSVSELYGEYGISDHIMGILAIPVTYNSVSYDGNAGLGYAGKSDSKFGIGEINAGVGISLRKDKKLVSNLYLLAGLPVDGDSTALGVRLSDDEYTQSVRLGVGYGGFYPLYINGLIGYSNRTKNYSDAINFQFGMGYILDDKWIFAVKLFGQSSLFNGDTESKTSLMFGANNAEYIAYGPEVSYQINKLGFFANFMTGNNPYNVIATRSVSLGLYYKYGVN